MFKRKVVIKRLGHEKHHMLNLDGVRKFPRAKTLRRVPRPPEARTPDGTGRTPESVPRLCDNFPIHNEGGFKSAGRHSTHAGRNTIQTDKGHPPCVLAANPVVAGFGMPEGPPNSQVPRRGP
jgi:hypothetical protein